MIKRISATQIEQECENCHALNLIGISDFETSKEDRNIIRLPTCSCGAIEFLNRTFDNSGKHARAVNSLYERLISLGKIHSNWASVIRAETDQDKPKNKVDLSVVSDLIDIEDL